MGIIRFTPNPPGSAGILRWDREPHRDKPDFHAIATIVWRSLHEVYLIGMHGRMGRTDWRDLLGWLNEHHVHRVHCQRAPGRLAPFAMTEPDAEGWVLIDVLAAIERYGRPPQTFLTAG